MHDIELIVYGFFFLALRYCRTSFSKMFFSPPPSVVHLIQAISYILGSYGYQQLVRSHSQCSTSCPKMDKRGKTSLISSSDDWYV